LPEGFKLLDAYVEVTASGKGVADKVAGDIQRESSGRLSRVGSGMGGNLLGGLRGAFTSGAVGGLVGGVVGGVTSGLTSLIGSAVSDIAGMLTQVGGMVATTVIDYNSTLQGATIGFETMLGSGRKAKDFLDQLQGFAKSTPFEFTDLVTSSQRLLAMGTAAKDVIPYMTGIGDAVAGLGKGPEVINQVVTAVGQMTAKGKVQGDDLMQLTEAGIPALKILADSYGVTTSKMSDMISSGDVLAKRAVPAIIKGLENGTKSVRGFGGMMDKQSHTFAGALSNIRDGLTQTTAKAFKPFFDVASVGMGRFAKALSGKPAEKFQKDVTKALRPFATEINKWFKGIDLNKVFTGASKAFKDLTKGLNAKDFGKFLKDMTKDAGDIFKDVVRIAPKVIKAIKDMAPSIMETIKQGVEFIGWIGDVIDWFDKSEKAWFKWRAQFVKGMDGFFKDASGFWSDMAAGWSGFWGDLGASIATAGIGSSEPSRPAGNRSPTFSAPSPVSSPPSAGRSSPASSAASRTLGGLLPPPSRALSTRSRRASGSSSASPHRRRCFT
jgi:tape measure domain-containing protein